jgi:hypothetical protein
MECFISNDNDSEIASSPCCVSSSDKYHVDNDDATPGSYVLEMPLLNGPANKKKQYTIVEA